MRRGWLHLLAILVSMSIGATNIESAKFHEKLAIKRAIQSNNSSTATLPVLNNRSGVNLISMAWHYFNWSQLMCLLKRCLLGSGNSWCHYGCYCGLGQKPYEPQDSIDAACRAHDKCWDEIRNEKKCTYGVWEHYIWELTEGEIACDKSGENSDCELGYCECDKALITEMKNKLDDLEGSCPMDPGCPV